MALVLKDRVLETTTSTGTGTITLAGAITGFQGFSAVGDGNTCYYTITGGAEWEVGVGTYSSSGTTLSRDSVLESSNNGNLVNFSAGTKKVFVTYPAESAVTLSDVQTLTNKTISMAGLLTQSAGADIASASTVDLTAATGNCPKITGTTAVEAWTMATGQQMKCIAEGALPLTYHATTNNIEGGASYTCAAGDIINLVKGLDGVVRVRIEKQDGTTVAIIPAFSAGCNAGISVPTSTFVKLSFQSEDFDTDNYYDASTSTFTPSISGYYLITARQQWTTTIGGHEAFLSIYKNGLEYKRGVSGNWNAQATAIVYLNGSTDYVEIYAFQASGGTGAVSGASPVYSTFAGHLIRSA